jgi:Na+/H+ antiporter NhaD/arsenite permease-like protein
MPENVLQETQRWSYSDYQTYVAGFAFLATWLLVAKKWAAIPIGKTAGALIGAVVMVQMRIISPKEANGSLEIGTLMLLLGLMLILELLETKVCCLAF